MKALPLENQWSMYLDPEWLSMLDSTPFLTRCRNGTVTKKELHAYVVQQFFYSRHFTRYLCAVLANMPNEHDRLELTENLLEEIGFGEIRTKPHSQIYRDMMQAMEINPAKESILPSTAGLIKTMLECTTASDPLIGLSALCMGAEAIVPHVYSQVVRGFEAMNEPSANLEFFRLHIEEDDGHAITMRNILDRELAVNPDQITLMKMTAFRLIQARRRFFEGLTLPEGKVIKMEGENYAVQFEGLRSDPSFH